MNLLVMIALWLLATPIFCIKAVAGLLKRRRFWSVAYRPRLVCRNCGGVISLVGTWECRCGYTYQGHVLRQCPVCGNLPRFVRCFACGTTELLPKP